MAPTICSDKKQQTERSAGISNLRRQARGLQRSNVPTASIINYVSKGVVAQLRQRTNSTTSNSSESSEIDLSGSATSNRRLQEQDQQQQLMRQQNEHNRQHREQQQHHHHRHQHHNHPTDEAEATHSSRSQISESAVSTSLPASPSPSTSSSSTSLPSPMSGLSAGHIVYINNNNNGEHQSQNSLNDYRVYSPHNTLSEGSMSPYQDEEERNIFYDADMEDAASSFNYIHNDYDVDDDFDTHSIASDFSDVAIDLSAHDFQHRQQQQQQLQRSNRNHQTVFNAPDFGDKQQHISVICSTNTTTTNSNNSNRNTNNNNNNNNNTTNYNNHNTTTTTKTICSDLLHNSRDVNYDLCEVKNTEGLLSIAIKTIKLVKRNQLLQRRLQQLQQETSEFIKSVMANPENRHYREKLEQKQQPPPQKQQRAE